MTTSIEQLENLQRRVERLERQNRLLRRLGWLTAVVLAVAIVSGQAALPTAESRQLSAESFRLVDGDGKLRGEFALGDEGPLLRLLDAEGQPQVQLAVAGNRPALDLFEKGKRRASIEVAAGDATATLLSDQGSARAMLSAGKDSAGKETAACALHDPLGNRQFAVTTRAEGTLLSLYDKNAVSRVAVTVNEVGSGYFIKDDKGKLRMQLQLSEGKPQFGLFDEAGTELFAEP
jgi:hypothetical protein